MTRPRRQNRAAEVYVGTKLAPLTLEPISRTTLALFAGASADYNPVHIDIDVARQSGFDDVFAHGMLSMAYLGRLLTGWLPHARLCSWRVRFVTTTPVGAAPKCSAVVTDLDGSLATLDLAVQTQDGTTTLTGTATVELEGAP